MALEIFLSFFTLLFVVVTLEPVTLTSDNVEAIFLSDSPSFVKFYAPWCGHCKRLAPTWDELSNEFANTSVKIVKVDCTQHTAICSQHNIRGYPTLKLFIGSHQITYTGQRDLDSLRQFIRQQTESTEGNEMGLVELDDKTFSSFLEKEGVHFVKFYAPWCGHCQKLAPVWDELAIFFKSNPSVHISKVDCTRFVDICVKYGIKGYPTLFLFENGIALDRYKGGRSLSALIQYIQENSHSKKYEDKNKNHPPTPLILTASNFNDIIAEGVTFVKFFTPWCGHCKRLAPTWDQLAEAVHASTHATIAKVDCTTEQVLCHQFDVRGYPTLILFSEGEKKAEYKKARDLDSLLEFIKEQI